MPIRQLRRLVPAPAFILLSLAAACTDAPVTPPSPRPAFIVAPPAPPGDLRPRVVFLPPLGDEPVRAIASDALDHTLHPTVEICEWTGTACAAPLVARFTTRDLDAKPQFYSVEWHTKSAHLHDGSLYRIRVIAADTALGEVDVRLSSGAPDHTRDHDRTVTIQNGRTLPIKFRIERRPKRLSVILDDGVKGVPHNGDSAYDHGAYIPYLFAPAPGFQNVHVTLDGRPAPRAGIITADTDHVLSTTADRAITLTADLLPLYQHARAILSAPNPPAAVQTYLDEAVRFIQAHDPARAVRNLRDVDYLAFDPVRDSAALRRLDAVLADHLFAIGDPTTRDAAESASLAPHQHPRTHVSLDAAPQPHDTLEPATFIYINGIWTTADVGFHTALELWTLKREIPLLHDDRTFRVAYFHNRTRSEQRPTPQQQQTHCVAQFERLFSLGYKGLNSFRDFLAACMGDTTYRRWADHDLVEAARQVFDIIAHSDRTETDAQGLADSIQATRNTGRHTIVVPHSQGNLMAIQAIHHLRTTNRYDPKRDSTCIGAVSLASPLSTGWDLPARSLAPIVVNGDIVPNLIPGGNTWPRIDTDSSQAALRWASLGAIFSLHAGVKLHNVMTSYFGARQSRDAIKAGLQTVYSACTVDRVTLTPRNSALQVGGGLTLTATLTNAFGDTLAPHGLAWTSSNSDAATVDSHGAVAAQALGATTITATTATGRHGTASVSVEFVYRPLSGTWHFNLPDGATGVIGRDGRNIPSPGASVLVVIEEAYGRATEGLTYEDDGHQTGWPLILDFMYPDHVVMRTLYNVFDLTWHRDRDILAGTYTVRAWLPGIGFFDNTIPVQLTRVTPTNP